MTALSHPRLGTPRLGTPRLALLLGVLSLGACDTDEPDDNNLGGQFGEEDDDGCQVVEELPLDLDEVSELGTSPQELLDLAEGEHLATLTWADASTTGLTLTVNDPTNARYLTYDYVSSDGAEIDVYCPSELVIDYSLELLTEDGALSETLDASLVLTEDGEQGTWLRLEDLSGSFDPEDYAPEAFDKTWADLQVSFDEAGISGEISGSGEKTQGSGDDAAVSLTYFEIGSF